ERPEIRANRRVVVRTVHLTGLHDHDRSAFLGHVEGDLVGSPLGVFIRRCRRRGRTMSLRDDYAVRVSERRDRGDVHDPRGPGPSCRVEDATSARDIRLLHLAASLGAHADLVDRRTMYERVAAADLADRAAWID